MQEWLSARQVARRLRVRNTKVLEWIRSGRLPAADFGTRLRSSYRISVEDLQTFVESLRVRPVTQNRRRRKPERDFFPDIDDSR